MSGHDRIQVIPLAHLLIENVTAKSVLYILVPSLADVGLRIRTAFAMLFTYYNGFVNLSKL